jgi:glycosyltransferase involved in cell wall biosynthesis
MKTEKFRKIHVLAVVRYPVGGIRTFLHYVYSRFNRKNHKFTFLLPETSELEALRENLKDIDCNFIVLDKNAGLLVFIRTLFRVFKGSDIDIVHSHGFTSMISSVIPTSFYRKPHLLTSHDVFTEKQFVGFRGLVKKIILLVCFHFVDVIHSVSHGAQDNLLSYFPGLQERLSKLVVIPNGIEVERFLIDQQQDLRKQIALDDRTFLIGFFGRFMAQKGFKYLIEAMDIILKSDIDVKPVVLAFGWGGFIREEQAEIQSRGLQAYFHFLPFQENPARAIRSVDVVVIPSLWEACPLLPMEVLVAGVPVIGTDCVGMGEVLRDTPARVVPAADSKALVDAINAEISSSSKKNIEQFRDEAAYRFDVQSKAEAVQNLIRNLVYDIRIKENS